MDFKPENLTNLLALITGVVALYFNYTRGSRSDLAEDYKRRTEDLKRSLEEIEEWKRKAREWEVKEKQYKQCLLDKDIVISRLIFRTGQLPGEESYDPKKM